MSTIHAEIEYIKKDGTPIHSDVCPPGCDSNRIDKEYRKFLHEVLDEWLDQDGNHSGGFYIKEEKYRFDMHYGDKPVSEAQKVILNELLKDCSVEYKTLVTEAFEANNINPTALPGINDLTYSQATIAIKYGNNLLRGKTPKGDMSHEKRINRKAKN
jgi:hypothetical protein